jgi:hypothetical protein
MSPRRSTRCIQYNFEPLVCSTHTVHQSCVNDFWAYGTFGANHAPILHWQQYYLQMDWNEIPHDQHHQGDPSGASNNDFEHMVRSTQTVHQSCVRVSTISKWTKWASTCASSLGSTIECVQNDLWSCGMFGANRAPILHQNWHCIQTDRNEIPHDPRHLVVLSGVSKTIFKPVVYSVQTVHLSCFKLALSPNRPKRAPLVPCHLGVPPSVSKMIFEPMVCLAQTEHLSCTNTNIVSKWTETRFHKTKVT